MPRKKRFVLGARGGVVAEPVQQNREIGDSLKKSTEEATLIP